MKAANGAVNTGGGKMLITAQEIQQMTKEELHNFFNSLSEAQARREAEDERRCRSIGNVCLKLDLFSEYSFD